MGTRSGTGCCGTTARCVRGVTRKRLNDPRKSDMLKQTAVTCIEKCKRCGSLRIIPSLWGGWWSLLHTILGNQKVCSPPLRNQITRQSKHRGSRHFRLQGCHCQSCGVCGDGRKGQGWSAWHDKCQEEQLQNSRRGHRLSSPNEASPNDYLPLPTQLSFKWFLWEFLVVSTSSHL